MLHFVSLNDETLLFKFNDNYDKCINKLLHRNNSFPRYCNQTYKQVNKTKLYKLVIVGVRGSWQKVE